MSSMRVFELQLQQTVTGLKIPSLASLRGRNHEVFMFLNLVIRGESLVDSALLVLVCC